jgi:hypothetical protein
MVYPQHCLQSLLTDQALEQRQGVPAAIYLYKHPRIFREFANAITSRPKFAKIEKFITS